MRARKSTAQNTITEMKVSHKAKVDSGSRDQRQCLNTTEVRECDTSIREVNEEDFIGTAEKVSFLQPAILHSHIHIMEKYKQLWSRMVICCSMTDRYSRSVELI